MSVFMVFCIAVFIILYFSAPNTKMDQQFGSNADSIGPCVL